MKQESVTIYSSYKDLPINSKLKLLQRTIKILFADGSYEFYLNKSGDGSNPQYCLTFTESETKSETLDDYYLESY